MTHYIIGLDHDPYEGTYGHCVYRGDFHAFLHDRTLLVDYLHEQWYCFIIPHVQSLLNMMITDNDIVTLYAPEPMESYIRLYTEHEQIRDASQWIPQLEADIQREFGSLISHTFSLDTLHEQWCALVDAYMTHFAFDSEYTPSRRAYVCQEACMPTALQATDQEGWHHWRHIIQQNINHSPIC